MSGLKLIDGSLAESFAVVFFFCTGIRALLMTELMFRSSSSQFCHCFWCASSHRWVFCHKR
jgi:hypothetical protein